MIQFFFQGIVLGLVVAISFGPAFFAIIQTGINRGFKYGVFMALGVSVSDILLIALCYLIGSSLFDDPQNKVYIGLIGGIILIIFGSVAWAKKPDILKRRHIKYQGAEKTPSYVGYIVRGFFLNIVNPFLFFFWFGAFGIISKSASEGHLLQSTIAFFSGTMMTVFLTDVLKSWLGGKIKKILKPRTELIINKLVGIALVIFGIVLIFRTLNEVHFFELIINTIRK